MNIVANTTPRAAPVGYFVHHQGRGHAERCAAVVNALPEARPVTVFCAKDNIFPALRDGVSLVRLPSLFEATGQETLNDFTRLPETMHCAPLGWPGIRQAMGTMAAWFASADPALMICDVSAEVAQLARICSVPHVKILQHGRRDDAGHRAAYDGAAGLLVPSHERLAQPDWTQAMRAKSCFAGGLGPAIKLPDRAAARRAIGVHADRDLVVVMSGGGGSGASSAPLAVGARARPDAQWISIGPMKTDWHATEPANLRHDGWVDNVADYLAAADLVVSSTGNTTCQQILAAAKPWLAVPEWRYFDEQVEKAEALRRAGVAHTLPHLPSSVGDWHRAIERTRAGHDPALQRDLIDESPAARVADWLEGLIARLSRSPVIQGDRHASCTTQRA